MEPFGTSGDVICPIPELQWLVSNARRSIPGQSKQSFGSPSRKGTRRAFTLSQAIISRSHARAAAFAILGAITFCHLLNDVMQALLPAIYPMLKSAFDLSFGQIGLLTLIFQVTASLLQPMVGLYTDRRPQPYSLPLGMACSLLGLVCSPYSFPAWRTCPPLPRSSRCLNRNVNLG